jgi:hypothetical protein
MAKIGPVIFGIILILIAGFGYITPSGDLESIMGNNEAGLFGDLPLVEIHELCTSGLGQLGQSITKGAAEQCSLVKYLTLGIYGFGVIGIILIIVGSLVPSNKREDNCASCGTALRPGSKFCAQCGRRK